MYAKSRTNRLIDKLQESNGVRRDRRRPATGKFLGLDLGKAPLSITITKKELNFSSANPHKKSEKSNSIPRIDLNLDEEPLTSSSLPIKNQSTLNCEVSLNNKFRPNSAGGKNFLFQTTKFSAESFNKRRNSDGTENFFISGYSFCKKIESKFKKFDTGRKWVLYRGRSLF